MSLIRIACRALRPLVRPIPHPSRSPTLWTRLPQRNLGSIIDDRDFVENDDEVAEEHEDEEEDSDLEDEEYERCVPRNLRMANSPHNLLVIQPRVKYGSQKTELLRRTTPELQLEEACTLVHSLDGWKVVHSAVIGTTSATRRLIFGYGNNETIRQYVEKNKSVSGIFFSVNFMYGHKQAALEEMFAIPVFDRFSLVMHIFRERAKTKEAKLQLALAELPYVKTRLREASRSGKVDISGAGGWFGAGDTLYEDRIQILKERERKIKKKIALLKVGRQVIRTQRQKKHIPTVAVVGYTNCGKTSLIKALTGSDRLLPQNKLFATVDVRVFPGRLEKVSQVLYIDTIGFISDIPTDLIESFKSTLEEVNLADLIIHVQDVSHPDLRNQRETVLSTLKSMGISDKLMATMAEVGNKVDKLPDEAACRTAAKSVDLIISATRQLNLKQLKEQISRRLLVNMGCFMVRARIASGGPEYCWLLRNAIILTQEVDPSDHNFVFMNLRLTEAVAGKFRRQFGTESFIRKRDSEDQSASHSRAGSDCVSDHQVP